MRPESVVLVRHARSIANDDPAIYKQMPDHRIPLARPEDDPGAHEVGMRLRGLSLDPARVCAWSSTYLRCLQTRDQVLSACFGAQAAAVVRRESFLLREQEFGDWDGMDEPEIEKFDPVRFARMKRLTDHLGRFYFRYPCGESRADVVQRCTQLIGKLQRSRYPHHLVFLHGVSQRALRMAWFNRPVEWFESEPNPRNCEAVRFTLVPHPTKDRWQEERL
jgi:broad specificity phosphatase PhoE